MGTPKTGPDTPEAEYVVFKAMGKAGETPELWVVDSRKLPSFMGPQYRP